MKTSVLLLALASLASCSIIDPPLSLGESRSNRADGRTYGNGPVQSGSGLQTPDSTWLVSAVAFPDSYDWQRDSAFGAVSCRLLLYRNGKIALDVPAGPGAHIGVAPDKHHIIEASLFTEYTDGRSTWIKKNGEDLVSWEGAERLLGLLVRDGTVHSIGTSQSGSYFTYRQNGRIMLKIANGLVMGEFCCSGYGPTGALYEDSGRVCFAYSTQTGGVRSVFMVRDGKSETIMTVPGIEVLDARLRNGDPLILFNESGKSKLLEKGITRTIGHPGCSRWLEGRLTEYGGRPAVSGTFLDNGGKQRNAIGWIGGAINTGQNPGYVYCDGESFYKIDMIPPSNPDCYFFHRNCAVLTENGLAMVLTPRDTGKPPYMKYGGKTVLFNHYGYLSGISLLIGE